MAERTDTQGKKRVTLEELEGEIRRSIANLLANVRATTNQDDHYEAASICQYYNFEFLKRWRSEEMTLGKCQQLAHKAVFKRLRREAGPQLEELLDGAETNLGASDDELELEDNDRGDAGATGAGEEKSDGEEAPRTPEESGGVPVGTLVEPGDESGGEGDGVYLGCPKCREGLQFIESEGEIGCPNGCHKKVADPPKAG